MQRSVTHRQLSSFCDKCMCSLTAEVMLAFCRFHGGDRNQAIALDS